MAETQDLRTEFQAQLFKTKILNNWHASMLENRKYFTETELASLLRVITKPRDRAIFLISYWRGLRASEVGRLKLSDWDRRGRRLYVFRLKKSLESDALISPAEQRALVAWVAIRGNHPGPLFPSREYGATQRGISRQMLHLLMREYAGKAGLPTDLRHMHTLKHSIATHLLGKGADLQAVKEWLGHRAFSSTLEYAKLRSRQRDKIAAGIYGLDLDEAKEKK